MENSFFTNDIYETEIRLDVNADVLDRIYSSNVTSEATLPIEFFFVSDKKENIRKLGMYLLAMFPSYSNLKTRSFDNLFELEGTTHPIKMDLESVNRWNQQMWDIGYEFDCKLDGWQVET